MPTAERLAALKRLHVEWTAELEQLRHTDPERASHHAEAVADLLGLIRRLENGRGLSRQRTDVSE